jgi:isocitrate dehydrogenase
MDFARAVVERLGQEPQHLPPKRYGAAKPFNQQRFEIKPIQDQKMELVGVDIFISAPTTPTALAKKLEPVHTFQSLHLKSITNRGIQVWPDGDENTFCTGSWRLRFLSDQPIPQTMVNDLLQQLTQMNYCITATSSLFNVNGKPAYTLAQGE